jgi:hypothetical protein
VGAVDDGGGVKDRQAAFARIELAAAAGTGLHLTPSEVLEIDALLEDLEAFYSAGLPTADPDPQSARTTSRP